MKMQNTIPFNKHYKREEDFSQELSENISLLNIGNFDESETEAHVGTRAADIVVKGADGTLVIENQFGKADWDHWGRLEAYARLKNANVAALIAEDFEELMIVTCDLRNQDSDIDWYLIKAQVNDRDEFTFHIEAKPAIDIQTEKKGIQYSEFWTPIRKEGLFAGRPVPIRDEGWIAKSVRGINLILRLKDRSSEIFLGFQGEGRNERRDNVLSVMEKAGYKFKKTESPKFSNLILPIINKGRKDEDCWDEIREGFISSGTDIYGKLIDSDL